MYGYSGYGTNAYGSERQTPITIAGPIVKLATRVIESTYGAALVLMLRFRSMTLSDPQTTNQSLEL